MANNTLNSGDVKQALNRQLFIANSIKHGISKTAGVIVGGVMYFGFGLPVMTSLVGGLGTDCGIVLAADEIVMPLYGAGKITDRAYAQLQGK